MPDAVSFLQCAGLALAIACLPACEGNPPADNASATVDAPPTVNLPAVVRADPPLDRAGLLAALAAAASDAAAGTPEASAEAVRDGRQFEVRIRFGCRGPNTDLQRQWLGWTYDAERGALRVRAAPTITTDSPIITELLGDAHEAVEGFWVPRPWLLTAACPAMAAPAPQPSAPVDGPDVGPEPKRIVVPEPAPVIARGPRFGIVQVFTEADARTGRRSDRAYEAVKAVAPEGATADQGFNLVLSGRLRAIPGKPVIQCVARGADTPPDCIATVDFDRVWIERPDGGDIIGEWGTG